LYNANWKFGTMYNPQKDTIIPTTQFHRPLRRESHNFLYNNRGRKIDSLSFTHQDDAFPNHNVSTIGSQAADLCSAFDL